MINIEGHMKTLKEFKEVMDSIEEINLDEDSAAATTTTGGVANPDAKPMIKKSKFMGHPCVEVDGDTYQNCIKGKKPFSRWKHYVEDDNLRDEMKKTFRKNKRMLMLNAETGAMAFVR